MYNFMKNKNNCIIFYFLVKDLQRTWKSLRNSFTREQAKRKNLKSGSGRSTWKTYRLL